MLKAQIVNDIMFLNVFADADDSPSVNSDRKLMIAFDTKMDYIIWHHLTSVVHTRFIQVGERRRRWRAVEAEFNAPESESD